METSPITWRQLLAAIACAAATIVAGDTFVRAVVPTAALDLREASDGIADLETKSPEILVLGSSHARTFHVLGRELEGRTRGATQVVSIPLEMGKVVPYLWLIDNRIKPLLDDPTPAGARRRAWLKHFILLTEWWDTCPPEGQYGNLPSRAWTLEDFIADVGVHGLTGYNRNYLQRRWQRAWGASVLSRLRKSEDYAAGIQTLLGGSADDWRDAETRRWQKMVEEGADCLGDPTQMGAMARIVDFAHGRGLDMTIVLFPRKPGTYTERARRTTMVRMSEVMTRFAAEHGVRLVDMTLRSPLTDDDFMADFDHVNAAGNRAFARWALDGDLAMLLDTRRASGSGTGSAAGSR